MKILLLALIGTMVCGNLSATQPFPPKVFPGDEFSFVVGFPWPDQDKKVLIVRTMQKTRLFSLAELGQKNYEVTTAGYTWYEDAIGYVERFRVATDGTEPSHVWAFYFRDKTGRDVAINLAKGTIIDPSTSFHRESLVKLTIREAENLLASDDPRNRRTGAIHLGALQGVADFRQYSNKCAPCHPCAVL